MFLCFGLVLQQKAIADSPGSCDMMKVVFGKVPLVAECRHMAESVA